MVKMNISDISIPYERIRSVLYAIRTYMHDDAKVEGRMIKEGDKYYVEFDHAELTSLLIDLELTVSQNVSLIKSHILSSKGGG